MGFNYGLERRRFEARWSRLRVEYAANGMEESRITEMYKFDLREFNSNRRYAELPRRSPARSFPMMETRPAKIVPPC